MANTKTHWDFFLNNFRFTYILVFAIVVSGLFSVFNLPKESDPEVVIPIAIVNTVFPGASVEDVEELITNPIEDKLSSLDDVREISSTSRQGLSSIIVEFDARADVDEKVDELKEAVDEVKITLPEDGDEPIVRQISLSDEPILRLSLSGPFDTQTIKRLADELESEIERISGVSEVNLFGGQNREFQVIVDKQKLNGFGLALTQVTQAISQANSDIPVGSIETAGAEYSLQFASRLESVQDIGSVPIASNNGVPVLVRDVARIVDGHTRVQTLSRLSLNGDEPNPAISINVLKASGANIVDVVDKVMAVIDEAQQKRFPEGVVVEVIQDFAKEVRTDLRELSLNGLATIIIVMVLLLLFLGWRESLLSGISIPLAFLISFSFLFYVGMTLNFLTLFSLILALGILVDSSIVMTEGINKKVRAGTEIHEAARQTIVEFELPLTSGTLTTVFAFVPMLLMSGIIGQFIKTLPITVTTVLAGSLFSALAILTTFALLFYRHKPDHIKSEQQKQKASRLQRINYYLECLFDMLRFRYRNAVEKLMHSKPKKRAFIFAIIAAFIISLSLPATGILEINMFPPIDQEKIFVRLEKPLGTPIEQTSQAIQPIEKIFKQDERVASFLTNIGPESHQAEIVVTLREDRAQSSLVTTEEYQNTIKINEGELSIFQLGFGPDIAAPVELVITGDDLKTLDRVTRDFEEILEDIPGARNVQSSLVETVGQFTLEIDRANAQRFGISTSQVALTLRNAVNGISATKIQDKGEDIDVIVKYALNAGTNENAKTYQTTIDAVKSLTIATPQGDIPLSVFTTVTLENSRSSIIHKNSERIARVTGFVSSEVGVQEIFSALGQQAEAYNFPEGFSFSLGGEDEDIQQSFNDMYRAMILAIVLIASLLVLQFRSFRQSLFILATIPLALIGVFPGLTLAGLPLSFPGIIGVVALVGIVVNNAIILVDRINRNRKVGLNMDEAILEASSARLEPIILTTITTVFGILPITLSNPIWSSLGGSIISGLLFSTVLTLFVIPLLYRRFARKTIE